MRPSNVGGIICILLQILECQGGTPVSRLNFFDIELLRHAAEGKKGNVMVSPASIKSTLAMILEGAKGTTAKEIKDALRVSPEKNDYREEMKVFAKVFEANNTVVSLQNANALFVSRKLNLEKQYESVVHRLYLAEINKLNFNDPKSAADTVNAWVDKKTHGLIPTIVDEDQITPSTEMMITNALYFKAPWKHGFNTKATYGDCFYNNGICKNVSMMILQAELNYAYVPNLRSHAVELPYQDDRYSMYLLVPQDRNAEITQIRDLPFVSLTEISDLMDPVDAVLTMPKFDVDYSDDMVEPLKNMRITTLFSQAANLSGIFGAGEYAYLNSIYHSVHMKVDEVGTIAAAASTSVVVPLINDQVQLEINRPFLFFIRDNKLGVTLFEGKIEEPTEFVKNSPPQGIPQLSPQLSKQPLASYNPQNQASGQTNLNPVPPKYQTFYQEGGIRTNYNQSALNKSNSYQGDFNQQIDQSSSAQHNSGLGSSAFSTDQPQVFQQGSTNQTKFNPDPQNYPKVNKPGIIRINNTSSSYQGGLNKPTLFSNRQILNHERVHQHHSRPSSRQPPNLGVGRRDLNYDYDYFY
ncbi:unnamed protein product [Arctia plantaginis]|uniref:Serpin domain-containing protein n=1 Tax=Arctia plantaginis TaxID=874455 RepID=A0A8S0ZJU5_ARCPL|nr:unnamed protein product [Arctia plantaginis]CAB3238338.1 unnamed protein product [Arctia plantaginis]